MAFHAFSNGEVIRKIIEKCFLNEKTGKTFFMILNSVKIAK